VATLDASGLVISSQAEIQTQLETDERAEISDRLDQSTSSPLGQLNRLLARALRLAEEGLEAVYAAIDPDSASGDALRRLAALTGTYQEPATATRVLADLELDAGVYAIGSLVVAPTGRPTDRLANVEEVTSPGGIVEDVIMDALTLGPMQITAGTLQIASPLAGFIGVADNPDGTPGRDIESEPAFRARRKNEVEAPGSSSAAGIVADLTQNIPAIVSASLTENDTDATVDGIPPHAIEAIVFGPITPTDADNDAVALQILASKAAGIGTYGNVTRTVVDPEGVPKSISFTRPTPVSVVPSIAIQVNALTYGGNAAVADKIVERAAEVFVPGLDASWSQVLAWVHEVPGVLRVTTINLGAGAFTDIAINTRQLAVIDSTDITIAATSATP
jgi:uncharacterized phage protein gp47/JayE